MSDLDMFYTERVRRALRLKDGSVDFGNFVEELCDVRRNANGLKTSVRRLEIRRHR